MTGSVCATGSVGATGRIDASSLVNSREHYCKACNTTFFVNLGERFTGDVFLVCPECGRPHYRHFAMGTAVHCDIRRRHEDPRTVKGSRGDS